jgi:uncharacterized protein (TIGR03792 family)
MPSIRVLTAVAFLLGLASVGGFVLEFLECNLWCRDVQLFLEVDNKTWSIFLKTVPGFLRKEVLTNPHDPVAANCTVTHAILWESRELWKSIDPKQLAAVDAAFVQEFGYEPIYTGKPTADGYDVSAPGYLRAAN